MPPAIHDPFSSAYADALSGVFRTAVAVAVAGLRR